MRASYATRMPGGRRAATGRPTRLGFHVPFARLALTATIFNIIIDLSDVDRGVYETLTLKVAQHPSESAEYMVTRILAYALEYTDGIEFSAGGLSSTDDPAIVVRDLTGTITTWIEIGAPDAERLHRAAKRAARVVVYTHRDMRQLSAQLEGKEIHRASEIEIYAFERSFIEAIAANLERRTKIGLSVTEGHLYLDVGEQSLTSVVQRHSLLRSER